jgi:hypothetical protein
LRTAPRMRLSLSAARTLNAATVIADREMSIARQR